MHQAACRLGLFDARGCARISASTMSSAGLPQTEAPRLHQSGKVLTFCTCQSSEALIVLTELVHPETNGINQLKVVQASSGQFRDCS